MKKFESQQARRILDRLVGYEISPMLWTKVQRGLSAGRVQSVAVRLVVERERGDHRVQAGGVLDRRGARSRGTTPPPFTAKVAKLDGKKAELTNEGAGPRGRRRSSSAAALRRRVGRAQGAAQEPAAAVHHLASCSRRRRSKLRFSPKRTMALAQRLYEGVELGDEGAGRSHHVHAYRLDAPLRRRGHRGARVHRRALRRGRSCPPSRSSTRRKKGAQDAHEAIRPTSLKYDPETVRSAVGGRQGRRARRARDATICSRLYTLIWNRFVACQMVPAVFDQTTIDIDGGPRRAARDRPGDEVPRLPRGLRRDGRGRRQRGRDRRVAARRSTRATTLKLLETRPEQHFTQPPPRFSEASLVKELEEKGIGRPSTYAAILSTIQDRGYVEKKEARFYPTELGIMVNGLLVKSFPEIVSTDFTAQMEEELDQVEEGDGRLGQAARRASTRRSRSTSRRPRSRCATSSARRCRPSEVCEKCGKPMVIKWGRNGHFLACSGYPECRNTKEFTRNADGSLTIVPTTRPTDEKCPTCGAPMVIKRGRFGEFLACSRYPECKTTRPISLGVNCPQARAAAATSTEKRSRRGKVVLRLLELLEDAVRLRVVGSPAAAAVPEVRRQVRRAEGQQGRRRASAASTKAATTPPTRGDRAGPRARAPPAPPTGAAPPPTGTGTSRSRAKPRVAALVERAPESGRARASVATASTWRVCGNMSNGCTRRQR